MSTSAITNPSRSALKGREARAGSPFRVVIVPIREKPAMMPGTMHDSAPPVTTRSTRPFWIAWSAYPMASDADVQPVEITWLMPRSSCSIDTSLESMPTNVATML